MVENITRDLVETALPKAEGMVKIVQGSLRGQLGVLKERNSAENRAVVQMEDDLSFQTVAMDDAAQWVGNNWPKWNKLWTIL